MSVYIYDNSLVQKLKKWTEKTQIQILGPDETRKMFEIIADGNNDKPVQLPIICVRRVGGYEILNPNKKPLTYDGLTLDATETKTLQLNAIPININYQIDVYTRYLKEADSYMRDIVFNVINHPTLVVTIPYNDANIEHNATIRLAGNVQDNSDVQEIVFKSGQFTRLSVNITIDDAYLWDAKIRNNVSIDSDVIEIEN